MEVPTQSVPVSPPPIMMTCLSLSGNVLAISEMGIEQALGVRMEKLHRIVDAVEIAPLDRQVARLGRSATEHERVELLLELGGGHARRTLCW